MIVNMKKNKKFQKEQLAEQGYTELQILCRNESCREEGRTRMAESMQGLKRTHRCGELSSGKRQVKK